MKYAQAIDIELLEAYSKILKIFNDVTLYMSGQTHSTASLVKLSLYSLMETAKPKASDLPAIHQSKAALYHDLESRFVPHLLSCSTCACCASDNSE